MAIYQFRAEQKIPAGIDKVWNFISSPANLSKITPDRMGFEITSGDLPEKMYAGMIVTYKVSPLPGFRTTWVTENTHVKEKEYFVDEQRTGPYSMWHHEHIISEIDGGVLMSDIITYSPPLKFLGAIANKILIRKQIDKIFKYRKQALERIFGTFS